MHPVEQLFNVIRKTCQSIHKRRLDSLFIATRALLNGKKLSLSGLGRNISSSSKTKHCIKRIDREPVLKYKNAGIFYWYVLFLLQLVGVKVCC